MTKLRATGPAIICAALISAAIPSALAEQTGDTRISRPSASMEGLSRPGIGAGPYRNGITLRRLPDNPAPCGPRQNHLFINRPCFPRTTGNDGDTDPNTDSGNTNTGNTNHTGDNKGGGPVIVLGGAPYNLDNNGPSGNHSPNSGDNPPPHDDTKLPDHFEPTPEPTYMVATGLMFAAVWVLARKKRTA
jgi:hypothetical protein